MTPILSLILKINYSNQFLIATIILAIIGIYRHKDNIKRLSIGSENKIGI